MTQKRKLVLLAAGALIGLILLFILLARDDKLLPVQTVLSGGRQSYVDHNGNLYYTSGTTFSKKTTSGKLESLSGQYDLPDITEVAWGPRGVAFAATNYNGNRLLFKEYIADQGGREQDTIWWHLSFKDGAITQLVVPFSQTGSPPVTASGSTEDQEQDQEEIPQKAINAAIRDDKKENIFASATDNSRTYLFDISNNAVSTAVEAGNCTLYQVRLPRLLLGCGGIANNETYILYNYETKTEEKRLKDKSAGRPYIVEGGLVMKEYKPEKFAVGEEGDHDHSRPPRGNIILLKNDNSQKVLKKSFDGVFYTNLVGNDDYILFSEGIEEVTKPFQLEIMSAKDQKTTKLSFYQELAKNIDDIRLTRISDDRKSYSFMLTDKSENAVYELTSRDLKFQYGVDQVPNLFAHQGSEIKQEKYTIVYDSTAKAITVYYSLPGPNGPIDKEAQEFLRIRGVDLSQYAFRVQPDTLRNP